MLADAVVCLGKAADICAIALPDTDRPISKVHATIAFHDSCFYLQDGCAQSVASSLLRRMGSDKDKISSSTRAQEHSGVQQSLGDIPIVRSQVTFSPSCF
jgi:predicted component of type VI protein secretion system